MTYKVFTYLAAPYSDPDKSIVAGRITAMLKMNAYLTSSCKKLVVTPLLNHFILDYATIPSDWGFWERYSKALLDVCYEMYVLKLLGWEKSVGVEAEIAYARASNVTVHYIFPNEGF